MNDLNSTEHRLKKIEKLISQNNEKLFGKYHELGLLLIGFLFSTIVGGAITYYYQRLQLIKTEKETAQKELREERKVFYKDFSDQINRRIYLPYRIKNSIEDNMGMAEVKQRKEEYLEAVKEFGLKQMSYEIKLELLFVKSMKTYYQDSVYKNMIAYHRSILKLDSLYNIEKKYSKILDPELVAFNDLKEKFNYSVLELNREFYKELYDK